MNKPHIAYYSYCENCPFEHHEALTTGQHPMAVYHKEDNPNHRVLVLVQIAA